MNTFQPCSIVTFDHFWHHAIKQFPLYLLFKNFTCTCLHCLLLTMRLWLKLVCSDGPTTTRRGLGFLVSLFRGRIYYIYIPQKYKVIPLTNNIYIHTGSTCKKRDYHGKKIVSEVNFRFYLYHKTKI